MNGPIDARRFLGRGRSLLDAVVRVRLDGPGGATANGLRVTSDLVFTLNLPILDPETARISIDDVVVSCAWSGPKLLVLRTPPYDGSLPELSLAPYQGDLVFVFVNVLTGEVQLDLARTPGGSSHDASTVAGSRGAPLFDIAWAVVGLHDRLSTDRLSTDGPRPAREFQTMATLLRELEDSPCWDEVAKVHRLVRSAGASTSIATAHGAGDLARAVRWHPEDGKSLSERDRRRVIGDATLAELRAARGTDPATSAEQRAIDRILAGPPYALDALDEGLLLPFATAARWFRGAVPELPDEATLTREIGCRRQLQALRAIAGRHFAPRRHEVEHLEGWLADPGRRAMVVRGPGGIGKSALLAHFILGHLDALRVAWLDFDRPDVSADEPSILRVVDEHLVWQPGDQPLIVVLDSFETSVQTYGYTLLNPALDALARRFPDLGVIVGSRTPVPLLRVEGEPADEFELAGLDPAVATRWLVDDGVSEAIAGEIARITQGVPLNLRLARDLVSGKSDAEARALIATLPRQLVTGYLYRRILRRLGDETLKEQAQWAMVPRRLVPELLGRVLEVPQDEAVRLFDALRREVTLLEGEAELTLRPDLRNTLLPLLEADDAARVRHIDTVAADFWAGRAAAAAAAGEAIYHCLRLGDVARADALWRPDAATYLRGYTIEEIPPASRSWLESRAAYQSVTERVEDLLARGQLDAARSALADQPKGVARLSASAKRRRLLGFVAPEGRKTLAGLSKGLDLESLETVILPQVLPFMSVERGQLPTFGSPWDYLHSQRARFESAIAAIGRVQLGTDRTTLGTAMRVGPHLFLTTRSVVVPFTVGIGHDVNLVTDRRPEIDLRAEIKAQPDVRPIVRIVLVHPYWDIALFEVDGDAAGPALLVETTEPSPDIDIVVIGHPTSDSPELESLFREGHGVKRVMPGKYRGLESDLSFGRRVMAGHDNAANPGQDHGAAVIDAATGRLLGVRFVSVYLSHASFVPAWELARDPHIQNAGVQLAGAPGATPEWAITWTSAPPARNTLIEGYLAWRAGDLERAKAVIAIVPRAPDSPADPRQRDWSAAQIDRALLEAAVLLDSDRARAGEILEQLVADVPGDAWPAADRDAVIATRLRLAVDADAELQFLQLVDAEPANARLMTPQCLRVLAPPRNELPWRGDGMLLRSELGAGVLDPGGWLVARGGPVDQGYSADAIAAARRVVAASERCVALQGWIAQHAMQLTNLGYILNATSGAVVRELAAAYIAFPAEAVHSVSSHLLEKTDLAPHPTKRWDPIVRPLQMLLRNVHGVLPFGIATAEDLTRWLDTIARSGRLGAYLTELVPFDTSVAWAAGLLHLSTPLPIEALLQRRFTAERSA